jgi:hypothetical protein
MRDSHSSRFCNCNTVELFLSRLNNPIAPHLPLLVKCHDPGTSYSGSKSLCCPLHFLTHTFELQEKYHALRSYHRRSGFIVIFVLLCKPIRNRLIVISSSGSELYHLSPNEFETAPYTTVTWRTPATGLRADPEKIVKTCIYKIQTKFLRTVMA